MVQQRHRLPSEVTNPVLQPALAPHVKGDGPKVARERGNLLEPTPTTKAKAADQEQGRPLPVDVVVDAGAFRYGYGHCSITSILVPGN
jgi:hypothetical protein